MRSPDQDRPVRQGEGELADDQLESIDGGLFSPPVDGAPLGLDQS